MIDLHSHILPRIDDGARNIPEAIELLRNAVEDGVAAVVATPHFFRGGYMPSKEEIRRGVEELKKAAEAEGLDCNIYPGSECYIDHQLSMMIREGRIMTINDGGRYLLIELPRMEVPTYTEEVLFQLRLDGITPIIAHPERNVVIAKDPNILAAFIKRGSLVQVNAGSLTGLYGSVVRKAAEVIVAYRMAHIIASDSHDPEMAKERRLSEGLKCAEALIGEEAFYLVKDVPEKVLLGDEIEVAEPVEYRPRRGIWARLRG